MTEPPDQPGASRETARQIVAAAMDTPSATLSGESGFRILWQQNPSNDIAPTITIGLPRCSPHAADPVAHGRLIWWPRGICERHRIAVMSSRIGAHHDQQRWWYDLLRTAILRLDADGDCVVAVKGTTATDAICRGAELFGLSSLTIHIEEGGVTRDKLADWVVKRISSDKPPTACGDVGRWFAEVSPGLIDDTPPSSVSALAAIPLRDHVTLTFGERVYVLACRNGGHVHRLLRDDFASDTRKTRLVCLADSAGTSSETFAELTELGAIPWFVDGVSARQLDGPDCHGETHAASAAIVDGPLTHPDDWLCHWTRPSPGPWPGQPEVDYLDELILGCETADRSALATLLQIISRKIVLASEATVRGERSVVSFTEVPLADFRERRIWRRHRRRYDFEPWGIAIRREALTACGARPVVYGSEMDRQSQDEADAMWFQPASDEAGRIDWSQEREWRVPDNVSLDGLPMGSVCIFVDSPEEASILASQCSWPVLTVPD